MVWGKVSRANQQVGTDITRRRDASTNQGRRDHHTRPRPSLVQESAAAVYVLHGEDRQTLTAPGAAKADMAYTDGLRFDLDQFRQGILQPRNLSQLWRRYKQWGRASLQLWRSVPLRAFSQCHCG